ncbi:hypothetical protein B9Z65_3966 [Elsinoe australis]|uniref:DUF924-domain-containing protein n=1 Tax=Elsinoe australis TaxID=40998 RepID=A0A2P7Z1G4_9PEZI|nr:hypothetical protein B9Z65_3966 [Elsinoe australis]
MADDIHVNPRHGGDEKTPPRRSSATKSATTRYILPLSLLTLLMSVLVASLPRPNLSSLSRLVPTIRTSHRAMTSTTPAPLPALDRTHFNPTLYTSILDAWFADQPPSSLLPTEASSKRWFSNPDKSAAAAFDSSLRTAFLPALTTLLPSRLALPHGTTFAEEVALAPHLAAPFLSDILPASTSPSDVQRAADNALAVVLLLDQIPRNIFRTEQGVIYTHFDLLSRAVVRTLLGQEADKRPDWSAGTRENMARRMWFYLPLMHSEWVEDHEGWTRENEGIAETEENKGFLEFARGFEERHAVIIKRFGRYPYRNEAVGRETTEEERVWIEEGGERFSA